MAKSATELASAVTESTAQAVNQAVAQSMTGLKEAAQAAGTAAQAATTQATENFATTQTKVKENMDNVMKSAEEFVAFGQGNLDAVMKSSQIWAAGVQDIGKQFAATAQANFEASVSAFKTLGTARTLKDAVDLQANLARTSLEKATSESTKLTEASLRLAEQTFAPIAARMNLAAEKFAKPV